MISPGSRTECAGNLPESLHRQSHTGKPGACTAKSQLPAADGTPYRGTSPPKAERTGRPPVLSYYYALGRKPRKAWKAEGSATSPARAAASASASPRAAPGPGRAATSSPSICHSTWEKICRAVRWARLPPGSPSQAGSLRPRGCRAVPRAPPAAPVPVGGGAALPPGRAPPTPAAVRSAGAFSGASPAGVPGPRRRRRRRTPVPDTPRTGALRRAGRPSPPVP